jgi:hypothetical protein
MESIPLGVIGNNIADYLVKKDTTFSQMSASTVTFPSAKSRIKKIHNNLSRYYTTEGQHKPRNNKRNVIPNFPRSEVQWQPLN